MSEDQKRDVFGGIPQVSPKKKQKEGEPCVQPNVIQPAHSCTRSSCKSKKGEKKSGRGD